MTVADVLKEAGFGSALIVDDAFDDVPIAADLSAEAWTTFIDDIVTDIEAVEGAFPQYHQIPADELRTSDDFARAMYRASACTERAHNYVPNSGTSCSMPTNATVLRTGISWRSSAFGCPTPGLR